jgi:hypothetical protein
MMADGSLLRSGGETWEPVWPDNVQKTGVSPGGQSGPPIVAAEAEQVERRPGHGSRSEVFVPYRQSPPMTIGKWPLFRIEATASLT